MSSQYEQVAEWAQDHGLSCRTRGRSDVAPLGTTITIRTLTIRGSVSVTFNDPSPFIVVEWGDGYRGDFPRGLPTRALTGLLAGFLHVGTSPAPELAGGEALYHDPFCQCGHKKNLHAGMNADGRCVKRSCGCGAYEAQPKEASR